LVTISIIRYSLWISFANDYWRNQIRKCSKRNLWQDDLAHLIRQGQYHEIPFSHKRMLLIIVIVDMCNSILPVTAQLVAGPFCVCAYTEDNDDALNDNRMVEIANSVNNILFTIFSPIW
jgi:hypothetical protein